MEFTVEFYMTAAGKCPVEERCMASATKDRRFRREIGKRLLSECVIGRGEPHEANELRHIPRPTIKGPGIRRAICAGGRGVGRGSATGGTAEKSRLVAKGTGTAAQDLAAADQPARVARL